MTTLRPGTYTCEGGPLDGETFTFATATCHDYFETGVVGGDEPPVRMRYEPCDRPRVLVYRGHWKP